MQKRKILFATFVIIIISACSIAAEARGFGPDSRRHGPWIGFRGMRVFLELKLSEAQQSKMLEIMDKYREKREGMHDRMRKARAQIWKVMSSEKIDEPALRDALRKSSSVREDLVVLRARMKTELKTILTPEQLKMLEDRKARFHRCSGAKSGRMK
jgi:Spy/CpxP family protein refolding chaperone